MDVDDQHSHQLAMGALAQDLGEADICNLGHVLTQKDVAAPSMPPSPPVTVSWCAVPCDPCQGSGQNRCFAAPVQAIRDRKLPTGSLLCRKGTTTSAHHGTESPPKS